MLFKGIETSESAVSLDSVHCERVHIMMQSYRCKVPCVFIVRRFIIVHCWHALWRLSPGTVRSATCACSRCAVSTAGCVGVVSPSIGACGAVCLASCTSGTSGGVYRLAPGIPRRVLYYRAVLARSVAFIAWYYALRAVCLLAVRC